MAGDEFQKPRCPGCRSDLDVISASGRADDLYLCPNCYNSWFAFELSMGEPLDGPLNGTFEGSPGGPRGESE